MKRSFYMLSVLFLIINTDGRGQNVGIGVVDPTRARLEVHGAPGVGTTSGIFGGDGAGISLQKDGSNASTTITQAELVALVNSVQTAFASMFARGFAESVV